MMTPKNRIIALIDFSTYSQALLPVVFSLAKEIDAKVVLLHQLPAIVVPTLAAPDIRDNMLEVERKEARTKLTYLLEMAPPTPGTEFLAVEDNIIPSIQRLRSPEYNDFIALGLKGTGVFKKVFMGSTTSLVIDQVDLPVIAVPLSQTVSLPPVLTIATSSSFPINTTNLRAVLSTFSPFVKTVEFVSVVTDEDNPHTTKGYLSRLAEDFREFDATYKIFDGNNPFETIKEYMKGQEEHFLLVQQGSRNLTDLLFRKFTINELIYEGSIPLIVIP